MQKIKNLIKAALVISVALAFILPGSAVVTNNDLLSGKITSEVAKKEIKSYSPLIFPNNIRAGENIQVSGMGDDFTPSICSDPNGYTVVTYTNQPSFSEGYMGISFSNDPSNPTSWNGWTITLGGYDLNFDTALVTGLEPTDYTGLMGVYQDYGAETSGYYTISDITADPSLWEFLYWTDGSPEPEYAAISDMTYYQDKNYPEMWGPFNFYIYHEIYSTYDIPSCPICFHTDVRGATGGVGYFDGQTGELTAPASDPDIADLGTRFHTAIQYNDPAGDPKIVWKKIVPTEEPDYEFTPYQDTIATGQYPSIAAYGTNVAVVYAWDGNIYCTYSSDDGVNWQTSTVDFGDVADITAIGGKFYCAYVYNGDLYLTTSTNGATWTSGEQLNDGGTTVVADENTVDISSAGVAFVDERNGEKDIFWVGFEIGAAPGAPTITGPASGKPETSLSYKFKATDPDGDQVKYLIDWGDGNTDTTALNPSGTEVTVSHTWAEKGDYKITAKAQDSNGLISPVGSLDITIPRTKTINIRLFDLFPHAFPFLRILLGL